MNSCFSNTKIKALKIEELYLSIEKQTVNHFDATSESTDVIVKMEDGTKYIASFFAYANIEKQIKEHRKTGEYLSGKYFQVDNMVLVENCSKKEIREVVEYMIDEGDFEFVFRKIT